MLRKGGNRLVSIENCVDALIQWLEEYVWRSYEKLITAASNINSSMKTNRKAKNKKIKNKIKAKSKKQKNKQKKKQLESRNGKKKFSK